MKTNQSTSCKPYELNKSYGQLAPKANNQFIANRKHFSISKVISTRHSYFGKLTKPELPIPSYQVMIEFGLKEKEFTEILNSGQVIGYSIHRSRKFYYRSEFNQIINKQKSYVR